MCTVLTTVKPCVVARLWGANVKRRKGPRDCAGRGVWLAAGLGVIGAGGGKPDRLGGRTMRGGHRRGGGERGSELPAREHVTANSEPRQSGSQTRTYRREKLARMCARLTHSGSR